ncbi:hypothetical protein BR10RB9215_C11381 [Brucella sp. 10RB9215]|nr:hypothetical protein BR10RB9215_C11381 [Brucella sp. 10RB9215]
MRTAEKTIRRNIFLKKKEKAATTTTDGSD